MQHHLPPLSPQYLDNLKRATREREEKEAAARERDALRQAGLLSGRRILDHRNERRVGLPDVRADKTERRQGERRSDAGDRRSTTRRQHERRE